MYFEDFHKLIDVYPLEEQSSEDKQFSSSIPASSQWSYYIECCEEAPQDWSWSLLPRWQDPLLDHGPQSSGWSHTTPQTDKLCQSETEKKQGWILNNYVYLTYIVSRICSMHVGDTEHHTDVVHDNLDTTNSSSCQSISSPYLVQIPIHRVQLIMNSLQYKAWLVKNKFWGHNYLLNMWHPVHCTTTRCPKFIILRKMYLVWNYITPEHIWWKKWQFQLQWLQIGNIDCVAAFLIV